MPQPTPAYKKSAKLSASQCEQWLEALLEVTGVGIYEHSIPLDESTYHSERWANILGYRLDELPSYDTLLDWLFERIHPDDRDYIQNAYQDFIEGRTPTYDVEIRIKHKNGQWIFVRGVSKVLERTTDGRVRRLIGMMFDLTDRKQAKTVISELHSRIEEKEFTLDALMGFIPEGITIASAPGVNILRVSLYGREMTGKPVEMLEGIPMDQHVKNWDVYERNGKAIAKNEDLPLSRAVCKGEIVKDEEWVLGRPDGSRIPVLCNAGPILDKAGKIIGGIVAWRDITRLKKAEKKLLLLNETLERRVAERTAKLEKRANRFTELTAELEDINRKLQLEIAAHKEASARIRDLNQRLIESQENERLMIARELHDSLAQELIAANMQCEQLFSDLYANPAAHGKEIKKVSDILIRAISSVRNLAYDLRPAGLRQFGIVETLHQFCNDFSEMNQIPVDFQATGFEKIGFDDFTAINLYRLVQEGLLNIKKHADASLITIRLVVSGNEIHLRIHDNGKGFDVQQRLATLTSEKKLGLRSMHERVDLLNGFIKIDSQPGLGTKLSLKIPISK